MLEHPFERIIKERTRPKLGWEAPFMIGVFVGVAIVALITHLALLARP